MPDRPDPTRPVLPLPTRLSLEGWSRPRQTEAMRMVEERLLEFADRGAARLGLDRRAFLRGSCGLAAGFLALNSVFGPLFRVDPAEAADPEKAAERAQRLAGQLVFDVQTHFVSPAFSSTQLLGLRRMAKAWNPELRGPQTLDDLRFESYFREVFLESDTALALLSNAPGEDPNHWFLSNEEALGARARVAERAGKGRLLAHAVFTPGRPGWLEELDRAAALKPDGWKGYTVGQPFGSSRWPWRLDDEKLAYPAYERMLKSGVTTVAVHKGLLPAGYRTKMAENWRYGNIDDLPKAAKDWPKLNFVIYHSALRSGGIPSKDDLRAFEQKGYIPWVTELAAIPEKHGVSNVYAEVGSVFAVTAVSAPRYCAGMLATLIRGLGNEKVLWGTDSVWYGSPQWQIDAFRRLEVPADLRKKFGFPALGPDTGDLKNRLFAGNARAVYVFSTEGFEEDHLARLKTEHRGSRK